MEGPAQRQAAPRDRSRVATQGAAMSTAGFSLAEHPLYRRQPSGAGVSTSAVSAKEEDCVDIAAEMQRRGLLAPVGALLGFSAVSLLLFCMLIPRTSTGGSVDPTLRPHLSQKLVVTPNAARLFQNPRTAKVAFLFMARGPLPLASLWELFFRGGRGRASVYVHASVPGFRLNDAVNQSSAFWNTQVEQVRVEWGGFGMVDAERKLLEVALRDPANQRFVLLSDSCIPIRSFDFVYEYLFAGNKSFLASYNSSWRLGGRLVEAHIPKHMLRKGSQWFALTRPQAELAAQEHKYYSLLQAAKARIPDETYLQTVIPLLDPGSIEKRPVTYVQWWGFVPRVKTGTPPPFGELSQSSDAPKSPPKSVIGHPRSFFSEDVSGDLIRAIQGRMLPAEERISFTEFSSSVPCELNGKQAPCYLFARKFAGETVKDLLELRGILGY